MTRLNDQDMILNDDHDNNDSLMNNENATTSAASALMQPENTLEEVEQPQFPKLSVAAQLATKNTTTKGGSGGKGGGGVVEYRRIRCPSHRYTPLRDHWEQIITPLVEYLKLQVGFDCV
jgi:hypothetical protein